MKRTPVIHAASVGLRILGLLLIFIFSNTSFARPTTQSKEGMVTGKVIDTDGSPVDYATVYLKGTQIAGSTNDEGIYHLSAPVGQYTLVVSSVGFEAAEQKVDIKAGERTKVHIKLKANSQLAEVVVVGNQVSKVKNSAFNATAVNTADLVNTNRTLGDALTAAPGMKIRESGGVGSDMAVTMDGFSGKHIKVFIDGVPQEGVGSSFGLNNIPVNYAERIEVYRGVVPVGFGADAIGGVINIVTPKKRRSWFAEASYSFGSFNTHKSYINFGQTLANGFKYEINAFQNYSDNNYWVDTPVEDFTTGAINRRKPEHVRRFNDTYHNEAVIGKAGFVNTSWADRLLFGFTWSHMYKEVQTGVRQEIVYGEKHRHGHSLMPSLEYSKRNLITRGLDVAFNANFNRDYTTQVDTSSYKYNWRGERVPRNSPGEQSYMLSQMKNNNWSTALTLNYRLGEHHLFTVNDVFNAFNRRSEDLLTNPPAEDEFAKTTTKNILGASYRWSPNTKFNLSAFGKYYYQYVSGPMATTSAQDVYEMTHRTVSSGGFGAAGTWFLPLGFQLKASYEKAYRLPTIEEMFGDGDLEMGEMNLKPESSHNINFNLSYNAMCGAHSIYVEGGFVYRDTRDYIQRNILALSGGLSAASYINYGKVDTKGFNLSARWSFSHWVSVGGNYTLMNVRDNMRTAQGSTVANMAYRERLPNLPYEFADYDVNFYWHDLGRKGNVLTLTYDGTYTHSFCYYPESFGSNNSEYMVPNQFAQNISLSYSIHNGRYNFSFECRNFTDARLYDNFSLQKAGRGFYGKVRVYFGK